MKDMKDGDMKDEVSKNKIAKGDKDKLKVNYGISSSKSKSKEKSGSKEKPKPKDKEKLKPKPPKNLIYENEMSKDVIRVWRTIRQYFGERYEIKHDVIEVPLYEELCEEKWYGRKEDGSSRDRVEEWRKWVVEKLMMVEVELEDGTIGKERCKEDKVWEIVIGFDGKEFSGDVFVVRVE